MAATVQSKLLQHDAPAACYWLHLAGAKTGHIDCPKGVGLYGTCPPLKCKFDTVTHTHTHPFNSPLSRTTWVSRYQKGKTNLDFTEARDSERQWHKLGHMQVCTLLQADNHANTSPLSFLQAGCPSCRPTNSVKALKASSLIQLVECNAGKDIQTDKQCNAHGQ